MKVGIIGLGAAGSSAAYHLNRSGRQVVGWDRFEFGHNRGSSHGRSRIVGCAYADPFYVSLMRRAFEWWGRLEDESGEPLLTRCGGLYFARAESEAIARMAAALAENDVPFRLSSGPAVQECFPAFRMKRDEVAVEEPGAASADAERTLRVLRRAAAAGGARLYPEVAVRELTETACGWRVLSDEGACDVDAVVIAAGAWAGPLLHPLLELPLRPNRQQYSVFAPPEGDLQFRPERFPVWIDCDSLFYGLPDLAEEQGAKVALHDENAPSVDPECEDRIPDDQSRARIDRYVCERLPGLAGCPVRSTVCLYTMTPDTGFVIDLLPGRSPAVIIGGLSGHGFKFVSLLGALVEEILTAGCLPAAYRPFSLDRFASPGVRAHAPG